MARTEVYINGKLADFNEIDLSFVYSVEDDDMLSVSGSFSKRSIKLPATKRNNDIFSNAILLQQPQNLNAGLLSLPARIIVDGIPVFIGTAQIDKAGITKLSSYYEVLFLADNSDWIEQMRDVGMDSIKMPVEIAYTAPNVMNYYIGYTNSGDGFTFFLPKLAEWSKVGQVQVEELYPAIFLDYIITQAFANLGYTINSQFFGTNFWRSLIIPVLARNYDTKYLKEKLLVEMGMAQATQFNPSSFYYGVRFNNIVAPNNISVSTKTYGTNVITTFRPRANGQYKITGFYTDTNSPSVKRGFFIEDTSATNLWVDLKSGVTRNFYIGDEIEFYYNALGRSGNFATSSLKIEYIGVASNNVPNITISRPIFFTAYYELEQLCKNWKLLDIISDVQKLFNLVFVTDTTKKEVTIEPRDYWIAYNQYGVLTNGNGLYTENLDITEKIDISKEIKQEYNPDSERYLVFNYKDDDPTCKAFEQDREGIKLYSHKFDRGARFKKGEVEIKMNFFNKCMHIEDSELWKTQAFNPLRRFQLPLLYHKNWFETPRSQRFPDYDNQRPYLLVLYGPYAIPSEPGETSPAIEIKDFYTGQTWTNIVPLAFMNYYNEYDQPAFPDTMPNISFAKEDKGHGLITNFHNRDLERKAQNVNVEAYLNWSNMDIFQLDFKRKYILNGVQTILKTIDGYNPATKTTTKTVFQVDTRLLKDGNNTNTEGIDSDLKGLIVI